MLEKVKNFCKAHVTDMMVQTLMVTGGSVLVISIIMFGHLVPYMA